MIFRGGTAAQRSDARTRHGNFHLAENLRR
jgi:hypothetical protein